MAPAIYFVPGVGQVALLATGAIVVGGVTIKAGSWLYKTISNYFNDPKRVIASNYGIPQSLLDSNGKVKLGSFKDKHGNTPLTKILVLLKWEVVSRKRYSRTWWTCMEIKERWKKNSFFR